MKRTDFMFAVKKRREKMNIIKRFLSRNDEVKPVECGVVSGGRFAEKRDRRQKDFPFHRADPCRPQTLY